MTFRHAARVFFFCYIHTFYQTHLALNALYHKQDRFDTKQLCKLMLQLIETSSIDWVFRNFATWRSLDDDVMYAYIQDMILGQLCFICQLLHHCVNASLLLYKLLIAVATLERQGSTTDSFESNEQMHYKQGRASNRSTVSTLSWWAPHMW